MIRNHEEYRQAHEAIQDLEEALLALRAKVPSDRLFETMAQDYVDSIAAIRGEVDMYTGLASLGFRAAPLWLGLEGADLSPGNIRTTLLAGWLERLRKAVATLAGLKITGQVARRYPQEIADLCDFRLIGFQPGSLKIGLDIPEPAQMKLFELNGDAEVVRRALEQLLEGAVEAQQLARGRTDALSSPDWLSPERTLVLRQVLRLVPGRRERVRSVTFEGALVPAHDPIRLDSSLRSAIAAILGHEGDVTAVEELEGTVREIDLDRRHLILRDRPEGQPDVPLFYESVLDEDAKKALDHRVRVEATRRSDPRGRVRALVIEVLEDTPL